MRDLTPTMRTPVYVKLDAPEQLLLSEGVCWQCRIITYHPNVLVKKQKGNVKKGDMGGWTKVEVPNKGESVSQTRVKVRVGHEHQIMYMYM